MNQRKNSYKERSVFFDMWLCVTKLSGMLQSLKVPITAEHSSNGISGTQGAQMAPKSSEVFCKGHKKVQPPTTYSMLITDSSGWFLPGLLVPHQPSESSTIIFFMKEWERKREQKRKPFKMSNHSRTGSLTRIGKKENIVVLQRTVDLVRAPSLQCLMGQETRRKRCRCRAIHQKM